MSRQTDGSLWAWGENLRGQLGDGTTTNRLLPVRVSGLGAIVTVAGGVIHSLAIRQDGTGWSWGQNSSGQLGDGTTTTRLTPVQISGLSGLSSVAGGVYHSLASRCDGTVWAWGEGIYGQLGNGTTTNSLTPVQVSGLSGVRTIAAGDSHSMALKSDGTVWSWGWNSHGQLGDGTTTTRTTPVQVAGLTNVVSISAGSYHSFAVKADGTAWAWGANYKGQLGIGSTAQSPNATQVANLSNVIQVAGGYEHSLGLKSDGTVWGWGNNWYGQVGNGTSANSYSTPTQAQGITTASAISAAGADHSLAVVSDRKVFAWGRNDYGQLGDGTTTNRSSPVQTKNLTSVEEFEANLGKKDVYPLETRELGKRMQVHANVSNGNFVIDESDILIRGRGLNLSISRFYNSRTFRSSTLGPGWSVGFGQDVRLSILPTGSAIYQAPSGYESLFLRNADGTFATPPGIEARLSRNGDGTYLLRFHGGGQRFNFTSGGQLSSHEDRNNNKITIAYNPNGTTASITDTQSRVISFAYGSNSLLSSISDPTGRSWQFGYDASNRLTSYTNPAVKVTRYAYDSASRLNQVTDPNGNIIRFTYDPKHRLTSLAHQLPSGDAATSFEYSAGFTTVTDARSNKTTYEYDHLQRVTKTTDALGNSQSSSYTSTSNISSHTDETLGVYAFTYDASNNLSAIQTPTGSKLELGYSDPANPDLPTTSKDPQGNQVAYSYDVKGNMLSAANALASQNTVRYSYNSNGTIASTTDANGNVTSYTYASNGNLTRVSYPLPLGAESFGYDALSRITSVTDGKGQVTTIAYDSLDRLTKFTFADASTIAYVYDPNGNVTTRTVGQKENTTFVYDAMNQMTKKTLPTRAVFDATYDKVGNLLSLTDSGGTTSYSYNAVNLLDRLTQPSGHATTFSYDGAGRRTKASFPNGVSMNLTYDSSGRQTEVRALNSLGATLKRFAYSYKAVGGADTSLRQSQTDAAGNVTSYGYDVLNRLRSATTKNSLGSTLSTFQYSYDGNGNRTNETINGTATNFTFNAANQLTSGGGTTYNYDLNGNLTGNSAGLSLSYNAKNQTISTTPQGGSAMSMTYADVGQDERTAAGSTTFSNGILGVASSKVGTVTTYFLRDDSGEVLGHWTSATDRSYYLIDGLGSVVGITNSSGSLVREYTYDPYGRVTASTGTANTPWRFAGGYLDENTGFTKFGTRYYPANLGRWTQLDPIASSIPDPSRMNRYVYGGCNPVNYIDPTGMSHCAVSGGFKGLVAGLSVVSSFIFGSISGGAIAWVVAAGFLTGGALSGVVAAGAFLGGAIFALAADKRVCRGGAPGVPG